MTTDSKPIAEETATLGNRVTQEVAVLLNEIEKEEVPDRLLKLAQDLQKALNEKLAGKA